MEGCGLACESPLLTGDEHARLKTFIGIAGTVCLGRQPAACLIFPTCFLFNYGSSRILVHLPFLCMPLNLIFKAMSFFYSAQRNFVKWFLQNYRSKILPGMQTLLSNVNFNGPYNAKLLNDTFQQMETSLKNNLLSEYFFSSHTCNWVYFYKKLFLKCWILYAPCYCCLLFSFFSLCIGYISHRLERRQQGEHLYFHLIDHRVATAAFWRTFSDEGKIGPGWWGWGVHAHPILLHLPSPVKLQCTLQLSGQTH